MTFPIVASGFGDARPASFQICLPTGTAGIWKRNPSPEFDVSIAQFVGALARFLIVGTVKLDRARHVAVIVQDIGSVTRHWLVPKQLDIILLDQARSRDGGCVALPN